MRIAYLATTVHVGGDGMDAIGSSTHCLELAKALVKLGHGIVLITSRWEGDNEEETIQGVRVVRLFRAGKFSDKKIRATVFSGLVKLLRPVSNFFSALECKKIVEREGCDAVLERSQSMVGGVLSLYCKKPLYLEVIDNIYCPGAVETAKKIFAYTKSFFAEKYLGKVVLVKAACNPEVFKPEKLDKKFDLCYAGSFKEWDGLEDLIEALALAPEGRKVRVALVGDGPAREAVMKACQEKKLGLVSFPGRIGLGKVVETINSSKACLAPYNVKRSVKGEFRKYGYYFSPLKVVEYMACARPVIATDYDKIRELGLDGKQLFREADIGGMAARISETLSMSEEGLEMIGRQNLEKVRQLTWGNLAEKIAAEMEEGMRGKQ